MLMQDITITVHGIAKQLSKLNPGKVVGPDTLSSRILKELHNEIAPILADIFNTSLAEGTVPSDWKKTSMLHQYIKNDPNQNLKIIDLSP